MEWVTLNCIILLGGPFHLGHSLPIQMGIRDRLRQILNVIGQHQKNVTETKFELNWKQKTHFYRVHIVCIMQESKETSTFYNTMQSLLKLFFPC